MRKRHSFAATFILITNLFSCDTQACISPKCQCTLNSVRCVMLEADEDFIDHITPEYVGLGIGQSNVVFRAQLPSIRYLALKDSSYTIGMRENPFPNLQTLSLDGGVNYKGFPKNNITQLIINNSPNLRGKQLMRVLRNVSLEFPNVEILKLSNMGLTFDEYAAAQKAFITFPKLKHLDMSGNSISSILVLNKLAKWGKMSTIVLDYNTISSIPLSDIKQIAGKEFQKDTQVKLSLKNQRMTCSCSLIDFQRWLKATEFFYNPNDITCAAQKGHEVTTESLLSVENLCQSSRKSTAVDLHGVGKMKSSVVALIGTGSAVGILAICVVICHYKKFAEAGKRVKKAQKSHYTKGFSPPR